MKVLRGLQRGMNTSQKWLACFHKGNSNSWMGKAGLQMEIETLKQDMNHGDLLFET